MNIENGSTRILIQMLLKLRAEYARLGEENRRLNETLLRAPSAAAAGVGAAENTARAAEDD